MNGQSMNGQYTWLFEGQNKLGQILLKIQWTLEPSELIATYYTLSTIQFPNYLRKVLTDLTNDIDCLPFKVNFMKHEYLCRLHRTYQGSSFFYWRSDTDDSSSSLGTSHRLSSNLLVVYIYMSFGFTPLITRS